MIIKKQKTNTVFQSNEHVIQKQQNIKIRLNFEKIRKHKTNLCFDAAERKDFGVFPAHLVDLVDEDPSVRLEIALRDREEHSRQLRFEEQHRVRSSSDNDPDENFEQRNLRFEISDLAHQIGCLLQDLEILKMVFEKKVI